ncbi:DUF106 domain-containing protein [Candidatus Woesearchaeota archaeon]|nr:DUF106 domain-containing protein [Candidatus Woesearchaeota archaeon]
MSFLDPLFRPLLNLPPAVALILISFIIAMVISIAYKFMTDQKVMKELKDDIKALQQQMKDLKQHPQKMMNLQKKMMEKNLQYMTKSLKPTLITFIPIIIIFGWLNAHYAYEPLQPGKQFTTQVEANAGYGGSITLEVPQGLSIVGNETQDLSNGTAWWYVSAETAGKYTLTYLYQGRQFKKEILVSAEPEYLEPTEMVKDPALKAIRVNHEKLKPFGGFNIFGWYPGWLGTYIIFSLIFSMALRKMMNLH